MWIGNRSSEYMPSSVAVALVSFYTLRCGSMLSEIRCIGSNRKVIHPLAFMLQNKDIGPLRIEGCTVKTVETCFLVWKLLESGVGYGFPYCIPIFTTALPFQASIKHQREYTCKKQARFCICTLQIVNRASTYSNYVYDNLNKTSEFEASDEKVFSFLP